MTLKRKIGVDPKSVETGIKVVQALNTDKKKKPLTKNELMIEFKALEKKHEEVIIENDNLKKKIAALENVTTKRNATNEQECQTKPDSKYVEISCTDCIFIASCEDELNYHMGEEHNKDFISYFETDFPCSVCDRWCKSEKDLNHHMKIYHGKRVKFCSIKCTACDKKIVNNENVNESSNSMDISTEEVESKYTYACKICEEKFETRNGMMMHRKKYHLEKVNTCWNFESDSCQFSNDLCWFRHSKSDLPQESQNCKFCGEVFKTKNDLQLHKKTLHGKTVPNCRNDRCWYGPEKCWFRHHENKINHSKEITEKNA